MGFKRTLHHYLYTVRTLQTNLIVTLNQGFTAIKIDNKTDENKWKSELKWNKSG